MSAVEKALKDMLDHQPWEYIKKNHSQGTIYRSLEKYQPLMERLYSELSSKVTGLEQEAIDAGQEVLNAKKVYGEIEAECRNLLKKRDQFGSEILALEELKTKAKERLQTETSKLKEVEKKLDELGKRHLTSENLTEILGSDIESPDDLLGRVKTKTEHKALVEHNQRLEDSLSESRRQEQEAASRIENLSLEIQSKENRLDEFKHLNRLWVNSLQVVNKAQQLGYTPDITIGVLNAMFKLSVQGEPIRSARRLLRRFEIISEEIELDDSITRKTAALKTVEEQYNVVTGALKAVKKDALGSIKAVERTALTAVNSVKEAAKIEINIATDQSYRSIRGVEQLAVKPVEDVRDSSCLAMDHLKNGVAKVFTDTRFAMQFASETYQTQVSEWGEVKEQAGRYDEQIKLATILLGIQQNPDALLDIEPAIITRLATRINLYIGLKWPGVKTMASKGISSNDWGISSIYMANLSSVSTWLVEALSNIERGGTQ